MGSKAGDFVWYELLPGGEFSLNIIDPQSAPVGLVDPRK